MNNTTNTAAPTIPADAVNVGTYTIWQDGPVLHAVLHGEGDRYITDTYPTTEAASLIFINYAYLH